MAPSPQTNRQGDREGQLALVRVPIPLNRGIYSAVLSVLTDQSVELVYLPYLLTVHRVVASCHNDVYLFSAIRYESLDQYF